MKKLLVVLVVVAAVALLGASAAFAAAGVAGTKHDIAAVDDGTTTETCVFCHTPHQTAGANSQDPLWNKSLSTDATYGVYSSGTMTMSPAEIGQGTLGSATLTHLCLSCHDGSLAVNAPLNGVNGATAGTDIFITGASNLGGSLTDDHPVNFVYDDVKAADDGGLALSAAVETAGLPLDSTGSMQCSTCHNVHDNTNAPFLRISNAASAMCRACHTNK